MLDGSEGLNRTLAATARENSEQTGISPAVGDHAAKDDVSIKDPLQEYRMELASLRSSKRHPDPPERFTSHPKDSILVDPTSLKTDQGTALDLKEPSSDSVYPGAEISKLSTPEVSCSFKIVNHLSPADTPKPLDLVKDKNPALYDAIKGKVKDPTYIGEVGDITTPTYDKNGKQIGCTVIKDTPYWLSGDAAHSYVKVKDALAPQHIDISLDPLNGAGRTLEQEKGINIRNPGRHAPVNQSLHGYGNAADIKEQPDGQKQLYDIPEVRKQLHENGFRQGDGGGPIGDDLHHWSYAGPGPVSDGGHSGGHRRQPVIHHKGHARWHHN